MSDDQQRLMQLRRQAFKNFVDKRLFKRVAMLALELNEYEQAVELATHWLAHEQKSGDAWLILAASQNFLGNFQEAARASYEALRLMPGSHLAHCEYGLALYRLRRLPLAREHLKKSLEIKANYTVAVNALSQVYQAYGDHEKSMKLALYAVRTEPKTSSYRITLGNALINLNRQKDAERHFRKCLKQDAENVAAFWNLVRSRKMMLQDEALIKQMQNLYVSRKLPEKDQSSLGFCLAKVYKDLGIDDLAFDCWSAANALRKSSENYSIEKEKKSFFNLSKLQPQFSGEAINPKDYFIKNDIIPIFIVGMPRSGTSLTEQILASHSKVVGLGELNLFDLAFNSVASHIDLQAREEFAAEKMREQYIEGIKDYGIKSGSFTDKMPLNFKHLAWIRRAFPEAKIVLVSRHPVAVCFSNFTQNFNASGMGWTFDLHDIADFFQLYKLWIEFLNARYQLSEFKLNYDTLVQDQEPTTQALLKFCGLNFEEACINFHKNARTVTTASQQQVKKPLYKGSSHEWKRYETWLKPLIERINSFEQK